MLRCCFPEEASDLSKSFDCIQSIVHGGSTVYQVICTRGRLRGRILALKKVSRSSKLASSSVPAALLHQTLHHPNIVSLYSITSALSSDYHVLEFCSEGNLSDVLSSRNPSILSEAELRRVLKGVGSALTYLKEERVIHRNVCPSTIFLAEDLKPKLSDFEQAVRLPQGDHFISSTYEMGAHPPPELLPSSRSAYDFAVDIWSLGCTVQRCIYGKLHASGRESHLPPPKGNYSPDLQDLLKHLLEINHAHRMNASQILKHPFITDDPTLPNAQPSFKIPGTFRTSQFEKPEWTSVCAQSLDPPGQASTRDQNGNNSSRPLSTLAMHLNHLDDRKVILGDITNIKPPFRGCSLPVRRVFSDPPCCITEEKPTNSISPLNFDALENKEKCCLKNEVLPGTYDVALRSQNSIPLHGRRLPMKPLKLSNNLDKTHNIPIGTTRPQPINTLLLAPKTHKLANGNLTILPSHSLLVDFRENRRRRGLRGDEVLLISPAGTSVKVFSAPHLSVPTCLIEPSDEYTIDTLPPSYWELYNDVYDLIRKIKQRTPQLTMNTNEAKCTLMANAPMGDIELLLNLDLFPYSGTASVGLKGQNNLPSMRIRYSRQQCFLEFAQHVVETRGSEWRKRVKSFTGDFCLLLREDDLSDLERRALHLLADFLQTCQKLEQLSDLDLTGKVLNLADDCSVLPKGDDCASVPTLASLKVDKDDTNSKDPDGVVLSQPPTSTLEIRFIPSAGWCIKRFSKGSSKAVYHVLFLDGATVTIEGTYIEFTAQSGNNFRCRIVESQSYEEVGQRMKFFDDFVRLFD